MAGVDGEQILEDCWVVKANARLDCKLGINGVTQRSQNRVDLRHVSQQTATGVLAINHRHRTSEVQIDARHRMLLQFARATNERGNVIPDHLGNRGLTSGVGRDGLQNIRIEERVRIDSEILGEIKVRSAEKRHELPKRKVRNILHRSKRQYWLRRVQQGCELE